MRKNRDFEALRQYSVEIHHFSSILALLHWDQETYMPPGGIGPRIKQISQLSTLIHEKQSGRKFKTLLGKLVNLSTGKVKPKGLKKEEKVALREWLKEYTKATKLPSSFVETFSKTTAEASQVWSAAKKQNNFKIFAPFLEKIIDLNRKKAEILGFEEHPYDALLEGYEPCMTTKRVGEIFSALQKELRKLIGKIGESKQVDDRFLQKKVPDEKQHEIGKALLEILPMDQDYSRLDISSHPFSTALHPFDSRITTRILPNDFLSTIFTILHETGHSLYEMGLPVKTWGTPLSQPVSLSIHESQSRWWETRIGRSLPFWKFFYPRLQKILPLLKKVPLEKLYKAMNKVTPSLIRVEADEVTYCLHVILRFEIEKSLISGDLHVSDLPDAWNSKMKEYLGVEPTTFSQGCLQDIHWSLGDFGYFPTYALGNLFMAQFFDTFAKKNPHWESEVASGSFTFIRDWLKKNIHSWGRTYNADQLAKKITGKPLSEKAYCTYLKNKYGKIYSF